jgi:hypothetical protein
MQSLQQPINRPHLGKRAPLVRWLQLMRNLPLVNRLHLDKRFAPQALRRKKPLEVRNSVVLG